MSTPARTEALIMASLAAMPAAVFGNLREIDRNQSIQRIINHLCENQDSIPGNIQEVRDFMSFLVRAYNYMGAESEAQRIESEARADANS